jgi:hypothetical protein
MSNPRPCSYCGHREFMLMPSVAIDISAAKMIMGTPAYASIAGQWTGNMLVCTRCTHTSFFTLNGPTMLQRVPGATLVTAQDG